MMPSSPRHIGTAFWTVCAMLALSAPALAQVVEPAGSFDSPQHLRFQPQGGPPQGGQPPRPSAQPPRTPAAKPAAIVPVSATIPQPTRPSLLDKPAEPARIELASGRLTIHADNSSLDEILRHLTADSGMTVDGLGADQRVFGTYGPGDPQEVLFKLLDGSGYNVVMLGRTANGTPKQLALSPRTKGLPNNGPSRPQPVAQDDDNDDEYQQQQQPPAEMPAPPQSPPENRPPNGARTPQQMLQELQMMRQQQLQQQQQQESQPQSQP